MDYVIVRGAESGVFAGYLFSKKGKTAVLHQARWLWYWDGAATIAQLVNTGTKKPEKCKFPPVIGKVEILDALQVFYCTEEARLNIQAVPEWVV